MSRPFSAERRSASRAPSTDADERLRDLERRLRAAEQRFEDFIDISCDWVWEMDAELRFTQFSGRLAEVSGLDPNKIIGRKREDLMDATLGANERASHLADLRARRPFRDFTYEVKTPKGIQYFKISGKPAFDESGSFVGYRGTGSNVTTEIEAQRRAQVIQARFIEAIEHIPASLMLHDADDRMVLCNTITQEFFPGLKHLLIPGVRFQDLLLAHARNGYIAAAVGREEQWVAERMEVHRNPSGVINRNHVNGRWVQIIERRTSDGGVIGIRMDVSEIKNKEEALARQTALLRATFDHINQGISAFDGDLKLVAFNERYLEVMKFPAELGEIGRPFADFIRHNAQRGEFGPGDPEQYVAERINLVRKSGPHQIERTLIDGTVVDIRGQPMPGGGFVTTYTDVTERHRVEKTLATNATRLEEYARELKQSNTELEQFAYIASHDLQEPLRMVGSYCQLLQRRYKGKLDKDADDFISFAVEGAMRMQRMINDLLAYSRVGRGGKGVAEISMSEVVKTALSNLQISIEESGARVHCADLPTIPGERTQLAQLFQNLIGNAIKFRGEIAPQVDISATCEGEYWHFVVKDNGIGIEPQYADRIFLIFQRLHDRSKYEGTGIGLAVCKKVVEQHGGRIWIESKPGNGTAFHFTLAASPPTQKEAS